MSEQKLPNQQSQPNDTPKNAPKPSPTPERGTTHDPKHPNKGD